MTDRPQSRPDLREQEYRRLLFQAKFRLSEMIGYVKVMQPNNTYYLSQLEFDRDDIRDFLAASRG